MNTPPLFPVSFFCSIWEQIGHVSFSIMWKPANPCPAGADWQMVAVGDEVCFSMQKCLEGINEQGSVNDRNCGILRLWIGQASFRWIKHFMEGNHSFFSFRTLHHLKACTTWRHIWKMPRTEVWAFVYTLCFYMDFTSSRFYLIVNHSPFVDKGTDYEDKIQSSIVTWFKLCWKLQRRWQIVKHSNQTQFLTIFKVVIFLVKLFSIFIFSTYCWFSCYWRSLKFMCWVKFIYTQGINRRQCLYVIQNYCQFEPHQASVSTVHSQMCVWLDLNTYTIYHPSVPFLTK